MTARRVLTAAVLASALAVALFSIASGGRLYPDTSSFAAGRAAWSSPLLALAGLIGGLLLVQLVAAVSLVSLAVLVWRYTRYAPVRGLVVAVVLVSGPWYPALCCAGADALGAVLVLYLSRRDLRAAPAAALGHLASGLAALAALALCAASRRRVGFPLALTVSALAELLVMRSQFLGRGAYPSEVQWRYLVPAAVAVLMPAGSAGITDRAAGEYGARRRRSPAAPPRPASQLAGHLGATRAPSARGGVRAPAPAPPRLALADAVTATSSTHRPSQNAATSAAPPTLSREGNGRAVNATAATPTTRKGLARGHRKE